MEIQTQRIGRQTLKIYQKIRGIKQKKGQYVLSNSFSSLLLSRMSMDNQLNIDSIQNEEENILHVNDLQPDQISNFIEGNQWFFLKIFTLMMKDNHPCIQIAVSTNYEENYLNETVPRTFLFELSQLRSRQQLDDQNVWLSLSKCELKIIYLIPIILEGIGQIDLLFRQIDFRVIPSNIDEAIHFVFDEIVRILLQHTKLLTRNIFHKLVQFWDMSIASVEQELITQPSFIATGYTSEPLTPFPLPTVQELISLFNVQDQGLQIQENVQQLFENEGQIQVNEIDEEIRNRMEGQDMERDHSQVLNDSSSYDYSIWLDDNQPLFRQGDIQREPQNNRIPMENPPENLTQRRMRQKRAEKKFNWRKLYTRCRNQRTRRQRLEQRRQQRRNHQSSSESDSEPVDPLDSLLDLRNRDLPQVQEQRVNAQLPLLDQVNPNISNLEPMNQLPPQRQPYHEITHDKREVDAIINELMDNDLAIAQSMANHIYHSLITYQIHFFNFQ